MNASRISVTKIMVPRMAPTMAMMKFGDDDALDASLPVTTLSGPVGAGIMLELVAVAAATSAAVAAGMPPAVRGRTSWDVIGTARNNVSTSPTPAQIGSMRAEPPAGNVGNMLRDWHFNGPLHAELSVS